MNRAPIGPAARAAVVAGLLLSAVVALLPGPAVAAALTSEIVSGLQWRSGAAGTRANREKVGTPMPIWRDGGVDGWIVFGGPARAGLGGGGGGRHARGGGAAVRGRALDRPPLGAGGPRRGASCRQAAGRRPEAADQRRGGGGAAGVAGGGEPPDPGRVPRPARRADRGAGAPLDGGPGAAAVRLDVKEAQPARGRAGAGARCRPARALDPAERARRARPRRRAGGDERGGGHRRRRVPRLPGAGPPAGVARAQAGRGAGGGQPARPQDARGTRAAGRLRLPLPLPAGLLARPEPDRAGLGAGQGRAAPGRGARQGRLAPGARPGARPGLGRERRRLLPPLRIRASRLTRGLL